jgi:site-specific DNA recombinase
MQLREGREWMARMGYPKAVEYVDHGVSGIKRSRPKFDQLMKAAGNPHDLIWVSKCDRFGRSVGHFLETIEKLDALGVRFVAPGQGIDTDNNTPMGRMMMHILAVLAEFERALIIERSTDGRNEKFATGVPDSWNLMFGFKKGKPEIEPLHQQVMQQIADWRDADYSYYEIEPMIAAFAATLGVKPPRGDRWYARSMSKWMKNRQGIGEYHRAKRMWPLPLLFDPVQWQRINSKSNKRGRGNPSLRYPLTGILHGICGKPMHGCHDHGTRYMRCEGKQKRSQFDSKVRCGCHYVRADILEDTVFDAIWEYLTDPARAFAIAQALADNENSGKPKAERDAKTELKKAKADLARVTEMTRGGDETFYSLDQGRAEAMKIRRTITDLETEIRATAKVVEITPHDLVQQTFRAITEGGKPEGEHRWLVLGGILDLVAKIEGNEVVITGKVPTIQTGSVGNTGGSGSSKCEQRLTSSRISHDPIPFILRAKLAA